MPRARPGFQERVLCAKGWERVRLIVSVLLVGSMLSPSVAFAERIRCSSRDFKYAFCATGREPLHVRVVRRYSKRACIAGRSWGTNRRGIWVNHGCDADFDFRFRGAVSRPPVSPPRSPR
jgi:hypothetical protein